MLETGIKYFHQVTMGLEISNAISHALSHPSALSMIHLYQLVHKLGVILHHVGEQDCVCTVSYVVVSMLQ